LEPKRGATWRGVQAELAFGKVRCFGVVAIVLAVSACACESRYPSVPRDRDAWGVFDVEGQDVWLVLEDVDDALARFGPFGACARAFGCLTERGGTIRGPGYSAVLARCDEGTAVVATAAGFRGVRVACLQPTTRERCETLIGGIYEEWQHLDRSSMRASGPN
jgi:hypothetical protein